MHSSIHQFVNRTEFHRQLDRLSYSESEEAVDRRPQKKSPHPHLRAMPIRAGYAARQTHSGVRLEVCIAG